MDLHRDSGVTNADTWEENTATRKKTRARACKQRLTSQDDGVVDDMVQVGDLSEPIRRRVVTGRAVECQPRSVRTGYVRRVLVRHWARNVREIHVLRTAINRDHNSQTHAQARPFN